MLIKDSDEMVVKYRKAEIRKIYRRWCSICAAFNSGLYSNIDIEDSCELNYIDTYAWGVELTPEEFCDPIYELFYDIRKNKYSAGSIEEFTIAVLNFYYSEYDVDDDDLDVYNL